MNRNEDEIDDEMRGDQFLLFAFVRAEAAG